MHIASSRTRPEGRRTGLKRPHSGPAAIRAVWLYAFLTVVACAPVPHGVGTPNGSEGNAALDRYFADLPELTDTQIVARYDAAEADGLFAPPDGDPSRMRLQDRLTQRYRQRFSHIPDILWTHIAPRDWMPVIRTNSAQPDPATRPIPPRASQKNAGDQADRVGKVRYKRDGGAVVVSGATAEVKNREIRFPPVTYLPPDSGQTATQRAEAVLSRASGETVQFGKRIGGGGMRYVYFHPTDASLVVKTYEPVLLQRMKADGHISQPVEVMTAFFIQREMALQGFLTDILSDYAAADIPPPFRLAPIREDNTLLENGIILQPKIKGIRVWKDLPGQVTLQRLANLDRYFAFHKTYNMALYRLFSDRYGLRIGSKITAESKREWMGIDVGGHFSNMFLDDSGVPILIDW